MEAEFTFDGANDARTYLDELRVLWTVWVIALGWVTIASGGMLALGGLVGLIATVWFTQPIHRRAVAIVPDDEARANVGFRSGPREKVFRKLAYGEEPLRVAVPLAGASSLWFTARIVMLALTVLGFVAVVFDYVS